MQEIYNSFKKTAIKRNAMSVPMRTLLKAKYLKNNILDFGCGYGDDVRCLREKGYIVVGYDKFNEEFKNESLKEVKYNVVTSHYMFNVIPDLQEHKATLILLKSLSNDVYVSVRTDKKTVKETWLYDTDSKGWWTPRQSFQRFYSKELISEMFGNVEYIKYTNEFALFKLK